MENDPLYIDISEKLDNWIKLRDFLEETRYYESFKFDMSIWLSTYEKEYAKHEGCGTAACLGGSVQILLAETPITKELFLPENNSIIESKSEYLTMNPYAEWLGIDVDVLSETEGYITDGADALFHGQGTLGVFDLDDVDIDMALLVLNKTIETGYFYINCWVDAYKEINGVDYPFLEEDVYGLFDG